MSEETLVAGRRTQCMSQNFLHPQVTARYVLQIVPDKHHLQNMWD